MKRHDIAASISALLMGLTLALVAQAQSVQKEQVGTAFTGKIVSVDAAARTLRVQGANGEKGVFHVDDARTTIMSGDEKIALSGLHEGDWVAVDADVSGKERAATYIEVTDDPSGRKDSSPALPTAAGATVEVRHNNLSPATVQIAAGQAVTFHNIDKMPGGHTVEAVDGSFSSPPLDQGQDWSHAFDVPGVYRVHIKEHPKAEASIVVE